MLRAVEIALRRSILLEHPSWSGDQIAVAARDALAGRGPYAILAADLLAARGA
jgi:hypothetical protein